MKGESGVIRCITGWHIEYCEYTKFKEDVPLQLRFTNLFYKTKEANTDFLYAPEGSYFWGVKEYMCVAIKLP
jgi:hypothetical protein